MGINAGRTNHMGVELQANYIISDLNAFPGTLILNGSFTITSNRFVIFADDGLDFAGNELPGIPKEMIFAGMEWKPVKGLSFRIHQFYSGKQWLNDANTQSYQGYYLTNLSGTYSSSIFEKTAIQFTLGINNVLDANYASMILVNAPAFGGNEPRYYYPGQPRNFFCSLSLRF